MLAACFCSMGSPSAAESLPSPRSEPLPAEAPVGPVLTLTQRLAQVHEDHEPRPTFVAADLISGKTDVETVLEGNVELRQLGKVLTTDHLTYWPDRDEVEALGRVRLSTELNVITGP